MDLDPRPGGTISAVMVPDEDGPSIPFTATYGIVETERRIQFRFTDPTEIVTMSLLEMAGKGTELTYSSVGAALAERAEAHPQLSGCSMRWRVPSPICAGDGVPTNGLPGIGIGRREPYETLDAEACQHLARTRLGHVGIGCRHRDRP